MGQNTPIAGTCYVKVNGAQLALKGKISYSFQKSANEMVVGLDGPHGHNEKPLAPFIKGTFTDLGGISHTQVMAMKDITVTVELKNGKTGVLYGAVPVGESEVDAEAGEYPIEWRGMKGEELL